jgi:hypothetical protein
MHRVRSSSGTTLPEVRTAAWIRIRAICGLRFDREHQTITTPARKREEARRLILAHPTILKSLWCWIANPKSVISVSCRFGKSDKKLGYGEETEFNSFRGTSITELENLGCAEAITDDIGRHRKQTMTYSLYSTSSRLELMREWIEKLSYRGRTLTKTNPTNCEC